MFSLTTTTRYNAAGQALSSTQKQLISRLSATLESKSVFVSERGLTSMQWSVYNEATKRTQYSTVPTSSITAEAVTVDGFALSQKKTVEITDYQANALNQYAMLSVDDITDFIPSYDAAGNQTRVKTSTGIWSISYDAENRPTDFTKVDSSGSTSIHCEYDHMGRRATKTVTVNNNVTLHQRYIYRGYLQIAALDLTRAAHPALWCITWDPTQPVATRPLAIQKDGTWYTYGWDLTKNICEVFGPAGYIRTAYTYAPYGEVTSEGDVTQPIQWSSEYNDTELGLVYYNYRHYNPVDGRWLGRDQDKYVYTSLYYVYSKNSPIILLDQYGLYTYIQFDSDMGHGWIRTGGIDINFSVKREGNNTYYESSWLFEGIGFYPMDNSTTKQHEYILGLPGHWRSESQKEYMYTISNVKASEYDIGVYNPIY